MEFLSILYFNRNYAHIKRSISTRYHTAMQWNMADRGKNRKFCSLVIMNALKYSILFFSRYRFFGCGLLTIPDYKTWKPRRDRYNPYFTKRLANNSDTLTIDTKYVTSIVACSQGRSQDLANGVLNK